MRKNKQEMKQVLNKWEVPNGNNHKENMMEI